MLWRPLCWLLNVIFGRSKRGSVVNRSNKDSIKKVKVRNPDKTKVSKAQTKQEGIVRPTM